MVETQGLGSSDPSAVVRHENIALVYQEALTAVVRLRSNRQAVSDANSFRAHMRQLLSTAEQTAQNRGYTGEDARLATFAVVAFLDESVLNLQNPIFADWPRKPMQEELFGGHVAGEIFFQSLQRLMERRDSREVADVLEVYYLGLLLGYRGRYGIGGEADLQAVMRNIADKIQRIRKGSLALSPAWAPPPAMGGPPRDPWMKRLIILAGSCLLLALLLFTVFRLSLGSGASEVEEAVAQRGQQNEVTR